MLMRRLPLVHDDGPLVCRVSSATNSYMDVSHPRFALALSSPADLGGVESRKINTEVGQLQNCSASVWCAKKLGDNCIVGAFFWKRKRNASSIGTALYYVLVGPTKD